MKPCLIIHSNGARGFTEYRVAAAELKALEQKD